MCFNQMDLNLHFTKDSSKADIIIHIVADLTCGKNVDHSVSYKKLLYETSLVYYVFGGLVSILNFNAVLELFKELLPLF